VIPDSPVGWELADHAVDELVVTEDMAARRLLPECGPVLRRSVSYPHGLIGG